MNVLAPSIILLLLCYFTLRYLKLFWEKRKLPAWSRYFLGLLAWGTLLGFLGFCGSVLYLLYLVVRGGDTGAIFVLIILLLSTGLLAKYAGANPELFDYEAMKPFLKDSLAFADPARKMDNIFIDLDRHEVHKVYREVTGKDLQMTDETDGFLGKKLKSTMKTSFAGDTRILASSESLNALNQPIFSPHLASEVKQAGKGIMTDVTDSWKINALKKKNHDWFDCLTQVLVIPEERLLHISLESEMFTVNRLRKPELLYRFKQDIYEFLLAVSELPWTEPYRKFVEHIKCTCTGVEIDAFKGRQVQRLLEVEIGLNELASHAEGFFNAGELKTTILC